MLIDKHFSDTVWETIELCLEDCFKIECYDEKRFIENINPGNKVCRGGGGKRMEERIQTYGDTGINPSNECL